MFIVAVVRCWIEFRFSGIRCADASGVRILVGLRPDICSPLGLRKRRHSANFRAQAVSCLLIVCVFVFVLDFICCSFVYMFVSLCHMYVPLCMYACMYLCMYVRACVCMYVCVYV